MDLKLTYTALTSPFLFSKMTIGTFILKEYVELLKIKGTDNHKTASTASKADWIYAVCFSSV